MPGPTNNSNHDNEIIMISRRVTVKRNSNNNLSSNNKKEEEGVNRPLINDTMHEKIIRQWQIQTFYVNGLTPSYE